MILFAAGILVGVLSYLLVSSVTGNATMQNPLQSQLMKSTTTPSIKATSCDADPACEVSSISSKNGIVKINGQLQTDVISTPGALTISPTDDLMLSSGSYIRIDGTLHVNDFVPTRDLGNAYVCVNNIGDLYRSEEACS